MYHLNEGAFVQEMHIFANENTTYKTVMSKRIQNSFVYILVYFQNLILTNKKLLLYLVLSIDYPVLMCDEVIHSFFFVIDN